MQSNCSKLTPLELFQIMDIYSIGYLYLDNMLKLYKMLPDAYAQKVRDIFKKFVIAEKQFVMSKDQFIDLYKKHKKTKVQDVSISSLRSSENKENYHISPQEIKEMFERRKSVPRARPRFIHKKS